MQSVVGLYACCEVVSGFETATSRSREATLLLNKSGRFDKIISLGYIDLLWLIYMLILTLEYLPHKLLNASWELMRQLERFQFSKQAIKYLVFRFLVTTAVSTATKDFHRLRGLQTFGTWKFLIYLIGMKCWSRWWYANFYRCVNVRESFSQRINFLRFVGPPCGQQPLLNTFTTEEVFRNDMQNDLSVV